MGFDQRLVAVERRMQVGEVLAILIRRQAPGRNPLSELTFSHANSPLWF